MGLEQVGKWSYIAGLLIVLLSGIISVPMAGLILFVLGLIVGFLNITAKESEKFLIATIALMVLGIAGLQSLSVLGATISNALNAILTSLALFAGASALVVAIKAIIDLGKD